MNDKVNYSYSFSYNLTPTPAAEKEDELIAFDDCLEFPLPEQRVLIRSRHSGKQIIVTNDVLYSLRMCHEFRTTEAHIAHLAQAIPELAEEPEDILQVLQSIRQAGLMLSARDKAKSIHLAADFQTTAQPLCFCILTCDRSTSLSRLLDSMAATHQFDANNRYYVIDDSREHANRDTNRAICNNFSAAQGVSLRYFGAEEQDKVLEQLKAALPEHARGMDFLLGRYQHDPTIASYGRSRNWGLLLGSGGKLLLIDDDILFQRVEPPLNEPEITFSSASRGAAFFRSDDEWQALYNSDSADPSSGALSSVLGTTLQEALAGINVPALPQNALRDLHPEAFHRVQCNSRVLLTSCGYAGDPGTTANIWLYQLSEKYRQQLLASEQDYQRHITARNVWLGSFSHTLRNCMTLMSPITGIDAHQLVPPFFPLFRNEDLLFGEMLHFLHPQGLFLDAPWAVPHIPAEHRQWEKDAALQPQNYGLLDFSSDALVLNTPAFLSDDAGRRLLSCSQFFSSLGQLTDEALTTRIAEQTLGMRSAQVSRISSILESSNDEPAFWKHDLQRIVQAGEQSLAATLPTGLQGVPGNAQEQRALARSLWTDFSQALLGWEACLDAMQDIQIDAS